MGQCLHPCEGDLVCKSIIEKVPYFNAPIYLENKSQIGKVDEIFGPMQDYVSFLALSLLVYINVAIHDACTSLGQASQLLCHLLFHWLGVPELAMGRIPLGLEIVNCLSYVLGLKKITRLPIYM